jgi:hypothetical protein
MGVSGISCLIGELGSSATSESRPRTLRKVRARWGAREPNRLSLFSSLASFPKDANRHVNHNHDDYGLYQKLHDFAAS